MKKRYIIAGCLLLIALPLLLERLDMIRAERLHLIPPLLFIFLAITIPINVVQRRRKAGSRKKKEKTL